MATAPTYNQAFDAPGYAAMQGELEDDVLALREADEDFEERIAVLEKMLKVTVQPESAPTAPSYTGNFAYATKTWRFTKPAFFAYGFGYILSSAVRAAPSSYADLLDDLIDRESPLLEEVV